MVQEQAPVGPLAAIIDSGLEAARAAAEAEYRRRLALFTPPPKSGSKSKSKAGTKRAIAPDPPGDDD